MHFRSDEWNLLYNTPFETKNMLLIDLLGPKSFQEHVSTARCIMTLCYRVFCNVLDSGSLRDLVCPLLFEDSYFALVDV